MFKPDPTGPRHPGARRKTESLTLDTNTVIEMLNRDGLSDNHIATLVTDRSNHSRPIYVGPEGKIFSLRNDPDHFVLVHTVWE